MKNLLIASLLLVSVSASAATYECFSLEESGPAPIVTVTIGKAYMSSDAEGNKFKASPVVIKEYNTVVARAEAVGKTTSKLIDVTLIQEGDIAVGSITAKSYMPGRLTGTLNLVTGKKIQTEIGCVVTK